MVDVVELAPAKINLTLRVLGRRPDGLHELRSLVTFADIGDRLRLSRRGAGMAGAPVSLAVEGRFAQAIVGENLVMSAIALVEAAAGFPLDADFVLEKNVPVASGIGGGSADAAAALVAIRTAFGDRLAGVDWQEIAIRLGADVPVCFARRPAWMTGIGEHLAPVSLPSLDIVLANACEPVPADKTGRVFAALGAGPVDPHGTDAALPRGLSRTALLAEMRGCGNELEAAATRVIPGIRAVKAAVAATAGCEVAMLSGAGPTVAGIFASGEAAAQAERTLREAHPAWWVRAGKTAAA